MANINHQKDEDIIDLTDVVVVGAAKNDAAGVMTHSDNALSPNQNILQEQISPDDILNNMVEEFEQNQNSLSEEEAETSSDNLDINTLDSLIESLDIKDEKESFDEDPFANLDESFDDVFGDESADKTDGDFLDSLDSLDNLDRLGQKATPPKNTNDDELDSIVADIVDEQAPAGKNKTQLKIVSKRAPKDSLANTPSVGSKKKAAIEDASPLSQDMNEILELPKFEPSLVEEDMQNNLDAIDSEEIDMELSFDELYASETEEADEGNPNDMYAESSLDNLDNEIIAIVSALQTSVHTLSSQMSFLETKISTSSAENPMANAEDATKIEKRITSLEVRMMNLEEIFAEQKMLNDQLSRILKYDTSSHSVTESKLQIEIETLQHELANALERISSLEENTEREVARVAARVIKEEIIPLLSELN